MGQARSREAGEIDAYIGRRLRKLRQERGLSLRALAQAMGHRSSQAVSKYEQGAAFPAALMFVTAEALGVPVSAFFDGFSAQASGVQEEASRFTLDEQGETTESRKIVALLRTAPPDRHALILRVVRVLATSGAGTEAAAG